MFELNPRPLSMIQMQLSGCLDQLPDECKRQLTAPQTSCSEHGHVPTLQMSYDEIPSTEIDRLLSYAGIAASNAPIGLDADFEPRSVVIDTRTKVLLFPLMELERHLCFEEPQIAEALRNVGSMDAFVEGRSDAMTAIEYLTAGTLACIQFCKATKQALAITW